VAQAAQIQSMNGRIQMRRYVPLVAIALSLVVTGSAMAAPTASQVTTPSDPSFPEFNHDSPNTLTVAGTTSGGSGNVDIRCYTASDSKLISSGVPVVAGGFNIDLPMAGVVSALGYPHPYCVLRAVPAGTTPADPSAFQGPHIGAGWVQTYTLGAGGGGVNPPETVVDYYIRRGQSAAFSDYDSAGSCGLCDTYLFHPATGAASNPIWWANGALYDNVPNAPSHTRSAVRIDGVDAYNPEGAFSNGSAFRDNPGFPGLSLQRSVNPVNGDLTIEETNPFVTCAPQPATYPPVDASCSTYASPGVRLVRTWQQRHGGLQVALVDSWQSTDGQPHQLDAYYDQTEYSVNNTAPGRAGVWNFPWTGDGFKSYPAQTTIPSAPTGPTTYFVKPDASTPDGGDSSNPIGAITLGTVPNELIVRLPTDNLTNVGNWQEHYLRTIPATGELKIEYVYSHDYTLASVQSMAADAEKALGGGGPVPTTAPPAAAPPAATPPAATAPPARCVVPKLRRKTVRRAKLLLRRAHCRVGRVTRKPSQRVAPGRVLTSKPRAGARRPRGTRVRLVAAR
jgi:hypothetical protein